MIGAVARCGRPGSVPSVRTSAGRVSGVPGCAERPGGGCHRNGWARVVSPYEALRSVSEATPILGIAWRFLDDGQAGVCRRRRNRSSSTTSCQSSSASCSV